MRKEKDVLSEKNVHHRAIAAEDRVRSNGREHHTLHVPKPFAADTDTIPWWNVNRWLNWETLTVAGRTIEKGLVVTPTMGLTIVLAIAAMMGTMYWRMNDAVTTQSKTINSQNELLIRLDQRLIDKESHDAEFKREQKDTQELQDLKIQDLKDRLLVLKR